jgi:ABC-2 type transport system permease protein
MAGIDAPPVFAPSLFNSLARAQYAAVLRMRWQVLVNSLRTKQGKFELGARIFATGFFATVWLGVGTGCAVLAYQITSDRQLIYIPALLWPVFLMWQVIPIMLSTARESVDFNFLLRFPVSFRAFAVLYLFFGLFDPSSLLGGMCILGIWIGVMAANPGLVIWITLALSLFALFNFLLTRMIFAWIERWLAKRRTREVLGIVILFVFLSFQVLNPALHLHSGHSNHRPVLLQALKIVRSIQGYFPPGLAGDGVAMAANGQYLMGLAFLSAVAGYATLAGTLLASRLRAEYRGESLGEASIQAVSKPTARHVDWPADVAPSRQRGWLDGSIGAVLVKEMQYLSRSGVMLVGLLTPLILLFAMGGPMRGGATMPLRYAFPIAIAYGFLPLTRQFCNSLGTEGAGIQLYFLVPTPFRRVMLAKNALQTALFCVELALVATVAVFRFGPPSPALGIATLCWVLFALPANLAAGNILSITLAYRMTLTRLSREQGSVGNGLLSLLIQLAIFAVGAAVYLPMALRHHEKLAAPVLLVLAAGSVWMWLRGLANVEAMANRRRETLIGTLVRSA